MLFLIISQPDNNKAAISTRTTTTDISLLFSYYPFLLVFMSIYEILNDYSLSYILHKQNSYCIFAVFYNCIPFSSLVSPQFGCRPLTQPSTANITTTGGVLCEHEKTCCRSTGTTLLLLAVDSAFPIQKPKEQPWISGTSATSGSSVRKKHSKPAYLSPDVKVWTQIKAVFKLMRAKVYVSIPHAVL